MKNKVPTAEEYVKEHPYVDSFLSSAQGYDVLVRFMIEFAKLHVEAALKAVISKDEETNYWNDWYVEPTSVKDSYPLENIK